MYAIVAVGGRARLLLHYGVPAELSGRLAPGHLVRVPLRDKERFGIVVQLSTQSPVARTRPILELIEDAPAVDAQHLALAEWMADFYLASLADCVWLMTPPPRVGPQRVRSVRLIATPEQIEAARPSLGRPSKQANTLDWLAANDDPLPGIPQVRQAMDCSLSPLRALEKRGWVDLDTDMDVLVPLISPQEARDYADELRGSDRYYAILDWLAAQDGPVEADRVRAATGCKLRHLRRLEELGLVALSESQVWRDPLEDVRFVPVEPPPLTPDQAAAWEPIQAAIRQAGQRPADAPTRPFLLHGVTGSGKTEIYLRAVADTLRQGRRAIVLVPEISLTPQTTRRFLARFPDRVGLFHSQLSGGERYDTWQRVQAGLLDIVVGPRSALFAPLPDLGLIVLDEEHDGSFKAQERSPAYHARRVALELARLTGAVVILGSATPSLESAWRAKSGEFRFLSLPQRIRGHTKRLQQQQNKYRLRQVRYRPETAEARYAPLPPVTVVDLRQELRAGNRHIFSRALQRALTETLSRGEQVILFLNRRGAATFVLCRDCGHVIECPRCDIPLTQHRRLAASSGESRAGQLVCHQCDYRVAVPRHCPQCQSPRIRYFGLGTQRVQEAVREFYPQARTLRWDRDTARARGAHELLLQRFVDGQADVLIGTQMVTKGLDLPLVTLVGVISADTALNLPDFRAAERTFQLLAQVAGRAGRGLLGGRVVVQTYNPAHYAIQAAARHDYSGFARQELAFRQAQNYPPYCRLARLEFRDRRSERAKAAAQELAQKLRAVLAARGLPATDLIGPAPAFFAKRRGVHRWHLILRAADPAELLRGFDLPPDCRVDIDPLNLL